ncbi:MAG: hypothetical protein G8D58_06700 [gamma proteobacterium symbiont of Phacoides pectinatus]
MLERYLLFFVRLGKLPNHIYPELDRLLEHPQTQQPLTAMESEAKAVSPR